MIRWFMLAWQLAALCTAWGQECGACHRREADAAASSPMSHAIQRGGDSDTLKRNLDLSFRSGNFSYSIRRQDNQSIYSVTDGARSISAPIEWTFGAGIVAQTYVYRRGGDYYEAAGRKLDMEARRCFSCHSTGAVWSGASVLESLTPGVQCAQCHIGAAQHAAAASRGAAARAAMPKLAAMETEELANLCGKCHPSWADIAANGPRGVPNVRYQFYRLANSRCYDAADTRIACTACHDVHGGLANESAAYDSKCQQCHSSANARAKICPVSTGNCITCHMPKVDLPELHYNFTDHQIRSVRAGDQYPN